MSALGLTGVIAAGMMGLLGLAALGYSCLLRPCRDCRALLELTAFHAAAHAVAGIAAGLRVQRIELRPAPDATGAVVWNGWVYPDGEEGDLVAFLAMLMAGQSAQQAHLARTQPRVQHPPSCQVLDQVKAAIHDVGVAGRSASLEAAAEQLAERLVTVHWELIRQLARRVLDAEDRRLPGAAVHEVCGSVTLMPSSAGQARRVEMLQRELTAVHEAAHAVIDVAVGYEVTAVEIHPRDRARELGKYGRVTFNSSGTGLIERVAARLAGQIAERRYLTRRGLLGQHDQPYGELVVTQQPGQDGRVVIQAGAAQVSASSKSDIESVGQIIHKAGAADRHAELVAAGTDLAERLVDTHWETITQVAERLKNADGGRLSGATVHGLCMNMAEAPETQPHRRRRRRLAWVTTLAEIWREVLAEQAARTGETVNDVAERYLAEEYLTEGLARLLRGEATAIQIADSRDPLLGRRAVRELQDKASTPAKTSRAA